MHKKLGFESLESRELKAADTLAEVEASMADPSAVETSQDDLSAFDVSNNHKFFDLRPD